MPEVDRVVSDAELAGPTESRNDGQLLAERFRGATYRALAARFGLSVEGARFVVAREARRLIDDLIEGMHAAQSLGELEPLPVPCGSTDPQVVIGCLGWVLGELEKCGVRPRVWPRPADGGELAFAIEDLNFPGGNQ